MKQSWFVKNSQRKDDGILKVQGQTGRSNLYVRVPVAEVGSSACGERTLRKRSQIIEKVETLISGGSFSDSNCGPFYSSHAEQTTSNVGSPFCKSSPYCLWYFSSAFSKYQAAKRGLCSSLKNMVYEARSSAQMQCVSNSDALQRCTQMARPSGAIRECTNMTGWPISAIHTASCFSMMKSLLNMGFSPIILMLR